MIMRNLKGFWRDRKDGQLYVAIDFKDEGEVVTVPIQHLTDTSKVSESGIWPLDAFGKRFQMVPGAS